MKPEIKYEEIEVPRLSDEVKKMNGKSARRLHQCIDELDELLEDGSAPEKSPGCPAMPEKED